MPAINNFFQFATLASSENILSDGQYESDEQRLSGNVPGIARQQLVNKALKQSSAVSYALGHVISTLTDQEISDDGTGLSNLISFLNKSFLPSYTDSEANQYLRINPQGNGISFVNLPTSSTTVVGMVQLSTTTEANAGTNATKAVTPAGVAAFFAGHQNITGNAGTATKLKTARTIGLSGGATGTATSFDGNNNITIPVTSVDATKLVNIVSATNLPVASATSPGIVSTTNQVFAGIKHFTDLYTINAHITNALEFRPTVGSGNGGYIDFNYNSTDPDYTSRIIEVGTGLLNLNAINGITITANNLGPYHTDTVDLGSINTTWKNVYATRLVGTADAADRATALKYQYLPANTDLNTITDIGLYYTTSDNIINRPGTSKVSFVLENLKPYGDNSNATVIQRLTTLDSTPIVWMRKYLLSNTSWSDWVKTAQMSSEYTFTGASTLLNGSIGLVPAPPKTNQPYYLLSNGTWARSAATTFVGDENIDMNNLTDSGTYAFLTSTLPTLLNAPTTSVGILEVIGNNYGQLYQRYTTYSCVVYVRRGAKNGSFTDWVQLGPPYAQTAAGIGQWVKIEVTDGSSYSLPAGGRWEYFMMLFSISTGGFYNFSSGVSSGGSQITSGSVAYKYVGFAKRVA